MALALATVASGAARAREPQIMADAPDLALEILIRAARLSEAVLLHRALPRHRAEGLSRLLHRRILRAAPVGPPAPGSCSAAAPGPARSRSAAAGSPARGDARPARAPSRARSCRTDSASAARSARWRSSAAARSRSYLCSIACIAARVRSRQARVTVHSVQANAYCSNCCSLAEI